MKHSLLVKCLILGIVAALGTVGCKKTPKGPTPIPPRKPPVTSTGPGGPTGTMPGGNPIDTGDGAVRRDVPPTNGNTGTDRGPGGGEQDARPENMTEDREAFKSDTVYFALDSSLIRASEVSKVEAVAAALKAQPSHMLKIEGHCDERGTESYNLALGERRALAVREALVNLGIVPGRVHTVSYGEDRPAASGSDEAAWAKNRRGEFILLTP